MYSIWYKGNEEMLDTIIATATGITILLWQVNTLYYTGG